jgi:hypothetical protein
MIEYKPPVPKIVTSLYMPIDDLAKHKRRAHARQISFNRYILEILDRELTDKAPEKVPV